MNKVCIISIKFHVIRKARNVQNIINRFAEEAKTKNQAKKYTIEKIIYRYVGGLTFNIYI